MKDSGRGEQRRGNENTNEKDYVRRTQIPTP